MKIKIYLLLSFVLLLNSVSGAYEKKSFASSASQIFSLAPAPEILSCSSASHPWGFFLALPDYSYLQFDIDITCSYPPTEFVATVKLKSEGEGYKFKFKYDPTILYWTTWKEFDNGQIVCAECKGFWSKIRTKDNQPYRVGDKYILWHEERHEEACKNWNKNNSDGKNDTAGLRTMSATFSGTSKNKAQQKAIYEFEQMFEDVTKIPPPGEAGGSIYKKYAKVVDEDVHTSIGTSFDTSAWRSHFHSTQSK